MSYSIGAKGANAAAALEALAKTFDEQVVAQQPIHAKDRDAALANAEAAVDLLTADDTQDVAISASGWLTWQGEGDDQKIIGASVSSSASLQPRTVPGG